MRAVSAAVSTLVLAAAGSRGFAQDAAPAGALEALDRDAQAVMERAAPSVVRVETERTVRLRIVAATEELRRATEERIRNFTPRECIAATGFVVDGGEFVLTTSAAAGGASSIRVTFPGGTVREGTLVGEDPLSGAALVRVQPVEGAAPLRFSEREPRAGALTLFMSARGDEAPALRLAFVTTPRRAIGPYDAYIVTSLDLAPGHAGAPLLDARGDVLGMAVAPRPATTQPLDFRAGTGSLDGYRIAYEGRNRLVTALHPAAPAVESPAPATFVPAAELRRIVADLRARGSVVRGYLGVRLPPPSREPEVLEVVPGSPASQTDLAPGDRFVSVDGCRVDDANALCGFLQRRAPGTTVRLVVRGAAGVERDVTAVLGELPVVPKGLFNGLGVREAEATEAFRAATQGTIDRCVAVLSVEPGCAGDRAGLKAGDVVLTVGGKGVHTEATYVAAATAAPAGPEGVEVVVLRGAERVALVLK